MTVDPLNFSHSSSVGTCSLSKKSHLSPQTFSMLAASIFRAVVPMLFIDISKILLRISSLVCRLSGIRNVKTFFMLSPDLKRYSRLLPPCRWVSQKCSDPTNDRNHSIKLLHPCQKVFLLTKRLLSTILKLLYVLQGGVFLGFLHRRLSNINSRSTHMKIGQPLELKDAQSTAFAEMRIPFGKTYGTSLESLFLAVSSVLSPWCRLMAVCYQSDIINAIRKINLIQPQGGAR